MPQQWSSLWKLLPNYSGVGTGREAAMPLILGAWHESTDCEKSLRLTAYIEWAEKWGALETVKAFLYSLEDSSSISATDNPNRGPRSSPGCSLS